MVAVLSTAAIGWADAVSVSTNLAAALAATAVACILAERRPAVAMTSACAASTANADGWKPPDNGGAAGAR